jgi:hypothetical protein
MILGVYLFSMKLNLADCELRHPRLPNSQRFNKDCRELSSDTIIRLQQRIRDKLLS